MTTSASPPPTSVADKTLREDQLVSIAARLFSEKGYAATSLRDIAEAAGISKAALYYWFPEKTSLFVRVVSNRFDTLLGKVQAAVDTASTPEDRVTAFMLCCAAQIDNDRVGWTASSNAFWSNFDPAVRAQLIPQRDRFEKLLRRCLQDAIDAGALRGVDARIATRFLLSSLNMMPRWHRAGGPQSAVEVMTQFLDMAMRGLRPR